jgi:hypothetical protein
VEEEEDDDDTGTLEDAPVTGEIDSRAVTATNRDRGCLWRGVGEKRQRMVFQQAETGGNRTLGWPSARRFSCSNPPGCR